MIELLYIGIILFGIGLAGVASNRNIILIIFSIELMLLSSIILLGYGLSSNSNPAGSEMIIAIWAVAALDAMVLVAMYFVLSSIGSKFDVKFFEESKG
jgi:NADH:ubiquinone oxidoreductase subunit K